MAMTLKTPPGPNCCCATSMPPHAAGVRASKKYEQLSGDPTKDKAMGGASGSDAHNRLIMVDFRLSRLEGGLCRGLSLSPGLLR